MPSPTKVRLKSCEARLLITEISFPSFFRIKKHKTEVDMLLV